MDLSPGGWGQVGAATMPRYSKPASSSSRRRCPWCRRRATHVGMANGVALTSGCEWHVAVWVRGEVADGQP
jgi:hypothetical protein